MKHCLFLLLAFAIAGLSACSDENKPDPCTNGVLDSQVGETEIDCGGPCEPCPPFATLTATLAGFPYVASSIYGQVSGTAIEIVTYGSSNASIQFSFVGADLNTPLPITDAEFYDSNDNYTKELSDTGSVRLTSIDAVRKIISGRFSFRGTRNGDISTKTVQNGQFANVRY